MRIIYRWSWLLVSLVCACSPVQPSPVSQQQITQPPATTVEPTKVAAVPSPAPIPCDQIVNSITERVDALCSNLGRNQACYGSNRVNARFVSDNPLSQFNSSGDIVNLSELSGISASPYDSITQDWGIALIKAQANLPDTLPGQNVLIMLIGDTEVSNMTPDLQAVTFRTGVGRTECTAVPPSAVLVQSPEGTLVTMNINGADITMGSTLLFTAEAENDLTVGVLEGSGLIEVDGSTSYLPSGQQVDLPLGGENGLEVIGVPSEPEPIPVEQFINVPIELLDHPITLPASPTTEPAASTEEPQITLTTAPSATSTQPAASAACAVRTDWAATYTVRRGDTLFSLSQRAGLSLSEFQLGNCIANTNQIEIGQVLRAPRLLETETPTPTISTPTTTTVPTVVTPTPSLTPEAQVFTADQTVLSQGQCTVLRWNVAESAQVFLDDEQMPNTTVQEVCPQQSTTYTLTVIFPNAEPINYTVTIGVVTLTPSFTPTPSPTVTPSPTSTSTPTLTPTIEPTLRGANFRFDQNPIIVGQCTIIRWDVDWGLSIITEATLSESPAGSLPSRVISVYGTSSQTVCPKVSTEYVLQFTTSRGWGFGIVSTLAVVMPTMTATPAPSPTSIICTPDLRPPYYC